MLQTMLTSLLAARPEPAIVNAEPGRPMSGVVFSTPMLVAGVAGAAIGPGSAATPGIAGALSATVVEAAGADRTADADRSSAPASIEPTSTSLFVILVLMVSLSLSLLGSVRNQGMIVIG